MLDLDERKRQRRAARRRVLAAIAVVMGMVLLGFELMQPAGTGTVERWFWFAVGVLLIGLGLAELRSPREPGD